jgi:hypothetical protein
MNNLNNAPTFTLADLADEFEQAGEDLHADLSAVSISAIRDVHYDDVEITVEVFGRDGADGPPIVCETIGADLPMAQAAAVGFFDVESRELLSRKGIAITWNPEWPSRTEINPMQPDPAGVLLPEDQ